ncbi:disintegrin and metalloproteinase domain-containing protein 9-like [Haliotis rufescens]|uniref:disintegrin and metalloproteinase domain-containing protein 9-like n=1 Tax=Haliotis rufescens TaxID=6454 RepID=UPI00201EA0D3|nr:disintegrin and metalloproteinase domain-containing protein 9-like [Haliotis rufescens]
MCMHYGTIILLVFLNTGTSVKDCTGRCVECRKGVCQWCLEQWYNHSCEYECGHCNTGGCNWRTGYCKTSCSPEHCGQGCSCKEEIPDANYRKNISDSIPNNIIVAFVIGIVFLVFIVFIFCGYNKCPEKDDVTPRTNRNTSRTARRTASSTTGSPSVMSYPSNGRSDVTSPLYPYAPGSQSTYRSNMASDVMCQPIGTAGRHTTMTFSSDNPPPPYGSLSPAGIPPPTSEGSAPPTYESLFPAKNLPDPR